jgi:hypothetical protein
MSDVPRPRGPEPSRPDAEPLGVPDGTAEARARLDAARAALASPAGPAGGAGGSTVPEAVWEDATRQLAGMLQGLATLQEAVPSLAPPLVPPLEPAANRPSAR